MTLGLWVRMSQTEREAILTLIRMILSESLTVDLKNFVETIHGKRYGVNKY